MQTNPANPKQRRLFYDLMSAAFECGEERHPQTVMRELSTRLGFTILGAVPQSLFDGWDYWVEESRPVDYPKFLQRSVPWKSIGEA